jgi:hypothetical protein
MIIKNYYTYLINWALYTFVLGASCAEWLKDMKFDTYGEKTLFLDCGKKIAPINCLKILN